MLGGDQRSAWTKWILRPLHNVVSRVKGWFEFQKNIDSDGTLPEQEDAVCLVEEGRFS